MGCLCSKYKYRWVVRASPVYKSDQGVLIAVSEIWYDSENEAGRACANWWFESRKDLVELPFMNSICVNFEKCKIK